MEAAARWLVARHADGLAWRDLLLVAPGKRKWRERIAAALDAARVPYRMLLGEPDALPDADHAVVHAMSMYGAAGLSFRAVAVIGLGDLPWKQQPLDEAERAVVAAIAVAERHLHVSYSKPSALVDRVLSA